MKQLLIALAISCAFAAQAFAATPNNPAQNSAQTAEADNDDNDDNSLQALNMLAANDNMAPAQGQSADQTPKAPQGKPADASQPKILLAGGSAPSASATEPNQAQKQNPNSKTPDASQPKILLAGNSPKDDQAAQKQPAQPAKKDPKKEQAQPQQPQLVV